MGGANTNMMNNAINKYKENLGSTSSGVPNKYIGGGGYMGGIQDRDESSLNTTPN